MNKYERRRFIFDIYTCFMYLIFFIDGFILTLKVEGDVAAFTDYIIFIVLTLIMYITIKLSLLINKQ